MREESERDRGTEVAPGKRGKALEGAALLLLLAAVTAALLPAANSAGRTRTDYDAELERVDSGLTRLPPAPGDAPEKSLSRIQHLYHRATLTGHPADWSAVEAAVSEALSRPRPAAGLLVIKAELDFRGHRLADARRDLEMIPETLRNSWSRTLLADINFQEGHVEEARLAYEGLLREGRRWELLVRLAGIRLWAGDANGANRIYADAEDEITSKEMRAYAWVRLQRGALELGRGRYQSARAHYAVARKAYSGYPLADEYEAELLGAERRFGEAAELYQKAITRSPRPELCHALGDLYAFMGRPAEAAPWHDRALQGYLHSAREGAVQYYHHLASFYSDVRQDGTAALEWARKDVELRGNGSAWDALAWALYRAGSVDESQAALDRALGSGARNAHLLAHAGMVRLSGGRAEEGKRLLREASELNPCLEDFHAHR
jgi:tetratricopeptide (TPR) repeat protein